MRASLPAIAILFLAWLLMTALAGCGDADDAGGGTSEIVFHGSDGDVKLNVEVAATEEQRSQGLMNRDELDEDSGMIFVWDYPTAGGFWMKDTFIPLSIAFISADGLIIDIQDMQPQTLESHSPRRSYMYAVEVNQGYFADKGIAVGDSVDLSAID